MTTTILPLGTQSASAIEQLLDDAFGPDRHGRTAYAIRQGMSWLEHLSFALLDDAGHMIGLLQSWPVELRRPDGSAQALIMVGPVAVLPEHQGDGYGRALMDRLMEAARAHRSDPLMMIGDPEYYGRFWGFSAQDTGEWDVPGPVERRRLLAIALNGEALGSAGQLAPRTIPAIG